MTPFVAVIAETAGLPVKRVAEIAAALGIHCEGDLVGREGACRMAKLLIRLLEPDRYVNGAGFHWAGWIKCRDGRWFLDRPDRSIDCFDRNVEAVLTDSLGLVADGCRFFQADLVNLSSIYLFGTTVIALAVQVPSFMPYAVIYAPGGECPDLPDYFELNTTRGIRGAALYAAAGLLREANAAATPVPDPMQVH